LEWPLFLPDSESLGLPYRLAFSEFVKMHRPLLLRLCKHRPESGLPDTWLQPYLRYLMSIAGEAQSAYEMFALVQNLFVASAEELAAGSQYATRCLDAWRGNFARSIKDFWGKVLTHSSDSVILPPMKSELQELLMAARRLTESRGMKSKLAKALIVPLPRVSDWLAGKYLPSGGRALKLREWVRDQQERQQKQSAGSVLPPPAPKTQSKASNEKKPKSGRKKD
jgi:hypothetical protein